MPMISRQNDYNYRKLKIVRGKLKSFLHDVMDWTVPHNSWIEALNPSTLECDPIWRQGLLRGDQIKIRPLGWALIQYDWCPYEKEKSGHRHANRKNAMWRFVIMLSEAKTLPQVRRKAWNRSFPTSFRRNQPAKTWSWTLASRTMSQ